MIVVFSIKYRRILVAFSIIRAIDNRSLTTSLQTISFWIIITTDHQPYRFFTGSVRADGCRWSCNSAQFSRLLWSLGWEHVLALHRTYNNGSSPVHLCSHSLFSCCCCCHSTHSSCSSSSERRSLRQSCWECTKRSWTPASSVPCSNRCATLTTTQTCHT